MIPIAVELIYSSSIVVASSPVSVAVRPLSPLDGASMLAISPALLAAGLMPASPLIVNGVAWLVAPGCTPVVLSDGIQLGHAVPLTPSTTQPPSGDQPQQSKAKGKAPTRRDP